MGDGAQGPPTRSGEPGRSERPTRRWRVLLSLLSLGAALISIPRDLVVVVPGHGSQKINTAHFWGDLDHPGDGPAVAKKTVEDAFGINVDYFARVDFLAFQRMIDAMGGIVVDVPRPIL